jgi:PPM family protein phosphatase
MTDTQQATVPAIRAAGDTNVGKVREQNEDAMIVDPERGLYVVLDGMGGANAGDVAAQTARDAIHEYVAHRAGHMEPRVLLAQAIQIGSAAVFGAAQASRDRHGMGTTCVGALVVENKRVIVGHVGDSRAYLLREGRLQCLTKDHTIVSELVDRGLLAPEDIERHPYKNVLSRNLGARPETRVDLAEVQLEPGDRLMLCSDGLYGYASTDAIQYLLGSGDAPAQVVRDLIELALKGGGGDNVSVIVVETPQTPPTSTVVVRTSGAIAWWQRRQRFLQLCTEGGLVRNPIVRGLPPDEALELIGMSVCQAIFHDLEKSTGVNVWTFAQNLAGGWFERGGEWGPLRSMMDLIANSSRTVVDELRTQDPSLGFLLDVAVNRALVVAELALGGLLAERLRVVDAELIQMHTASLEKVDITEAQALFDDPAARDSSTTQVPRQSRPPTATMPDTTLDSARDSIPEITDKFIERPTLPFLRPDRPVTGSTESAEVVAAIDKAMTIARARTAPKGETVRSVLFALEALATDTTSNFASSVLAARDLFAMRTVDERGIMPLFDALDSARILTTAAVHQVSTTDPIRARALRALSRAHQRLVSAVTGLVLEAVAPFGEKLREAQAVTNEMREQVAQSEHRRAELHREIVTHADPSLPWGNRGTTEW